MKFVSICSKLQELNEEQEWRFAVKVTDGRRSLLGIFNKDSVRSTKMQKGRE